ncbi:phenoloxidase-activating factor 3-like [Diabrotica virgifera virgifera]|uniref:CLIP domain-containing serine protease n=1 Tax=Diabrotica virgifera virgifera TaxID=50390 RepID=A0A6P7FMS9_DIAVI|nr:phenoloxidase-activating factor 3-like [Diabrotica virgifera virgifera]
MVSSSMALLWKSLLLFIITCFLVVVKSQDSAVDDDGCRTPTGGAGHCIPLRQCKPMINVLRTAKRPLSPSISKQLNAYYCNFTKSVCCPQEPIILQDDSVTEVPQRPQLPPDVSNHRNLNLLPSDCGYLDLNDRIRNGQDADLNEFPWMALLSYRTRRGPDFKCGGTIINSRYILTAAHCISNLDTPMLGVRVGEYNTRTRRDCVMGKDGTEKCINNPVQDLAIEKIIPHPQFDASSISNDIGLLRVAKINLNVENARPVCLPLGEYRTKTFKRVTVTGWGVTDTQTGAVSDILQKVDLPVVDLDHCRNVYKNQSRALLTYRQVCAGGKNNQDSCPGDSGGPLHVAGLIDDNARYIQQGVVSFGPRECGLEGFPGIYTRVAYYMDWILNNLRP